MKRRRWDSRTRTYLLKPCLTKGEQYKNCNISKIDAKCYMVKLIAWGFIQKQSPSIPAGPYHSFSCTENLSISKNDIRFRADPEATKS